MIFPEFNQEWLIVRPSGSTWGAVWLTEEGSLIPERRIPEVSSERRLFIRKISESGEEVRRRIDTRLDCRRLPYEKEKAVALACLPFWAFNFDVQECMVFQIREDREIQYIPRAQAS